MQLNFHVKYLINRYGFGVMDNCLGNDIDLISSFVNVIRK